MCRHIILLIDVEKISRTKKKNFDYEKNRTNIESRWRIFEKGLQDAARYCNKHKKCYQRIETSIAELTHLHTKKN